VKRALRYELKLKLPHESTSVQSSYPLEKFHVNDDDNDDDDDDEC